MKESQEAVSRLSPFSKSERQFSENTLASYRRDLEDYIEHLHKVQKLKV